MEKPDNLTYAPPKGVFVPRIDVYAHVPPLCKVSPRLRFQWVYFLMAALPEEGERPNVLNVGCSSDPLGFGDNAFHYDMDDWSARHKWFAQGDAADMSMFEDESFDIVICGDLLEHAMEPMKVVHECSRVAKYGVCFTIFEEWKLPGFGQYVQHGQMLGDKESRDLGYESREDYQEKVYPERIGVDDDITPHLIHINQFTTEDVYNMACYVQSMGFALTEFSKTFEAIRIEDNHAYYNWFLGMLRVSHLPMQGSEVRHLPERGAE